MELTNIRIGKIIKKRRMELNLELKDLQDYSGVNYVSISDIENGKANPTIKTLEKLLDVLGMQINIEVVTNIMQRAKVFRNNIFVGLLTKLNEKQYDISSIDTYKTILKR